MASGNPEPWEFAHLVAWWSKVATNIHHHHDYEETIFFPKLAERVTLPARLTADHKQLLKLMDNATETIKQANTTAGIQEARAAVARLGDFMLPHLKEEEDDVMPIMYEEFRPSEWTPLIGEMVKRQEWWELGHFFRPFGTGEAAMPRKRQYAIKGMRVPTVVWYMFLKPRVVRYEREIGSLIDELKDPELKAKRHWSVLSRVLPCCFA